MNFNLKTIDKKRALIYVSIFIILIALIVIIFVFNNKQEASPTTPTPSAPAQQGNIQSEKLLLNPALFITLSVDGAFLYYQNPDDGFFYKLNTTSNKTEKIGREFRMVTNTAWSPDKTKVIFTVEQDNGIFEAYNSPFKNSQIENGLITYWFYDFNGDVLKKISDDSLNNIAWSPDGNYILYNYTKIGETNTINNISIYDPYKGNWDLIKDGIDNSYAFNFIDQKNIFLLWQPTIDSFECGVPKKINLDTKQEVSLINEDSCFMDVFVSPKSRWGTYVSTQSSGFINIDTKENFAFNFGPSNIKSNDAFSQDGRYYYGFSNTNPDQIYKIDLNGKTIVQTVNTGTPLGTADQVLISPDEKTVYFAMKEGDKTYLYKTPLVESRTTGNHIDLLKQFASKNLPYTTNDYSIYWDENLNKIVITPNIGIGSGPFQEHLLDAWDDYKNKAYAAINWIKSNGLNIKDYDIDFLDRALWSKGETISIAN